MTQFPLIPEKIHHLNHLSLGNIDCLPVFVDDQMIIITRFGDFIYEPVTNLFKRIKRLNNGEKDVFTLPVYGWTLGSGKYINEVELKG